MVAAVAVNALIAWLLVLGGVVHLVLAFHARAHGKLDLEAPGRRGLHLHRGIIY